MNKDKKRDKELGEFDREAQKFQKKKNVHRCRMIDESEYDYKIHTPANAQDLIQDFE